MLNMSGTHDEALNMYDGAKCILCEFGLEHDYRMAMLHNNMSGIYPSHDDLQTAEELLNNVLEILDTLRESDLEIAIIYSKLASLYIRT